MVIPMWSDTSSRKEGWTTIHLTLRKTILQNHLISYVDEIKPQILLFLRQLRSINISVDFYRDQRQINLLRTQVSDTHDIIELNDSRSIASRYYMVKWQATPYRDESRRQGITESEIVLAFPIQFDNTPSLKIKVQNVHAFLPIRRYGFKVRINQFFLYLSL